MKALAVVEGAVVVADVVVGRDHAWKMLGSRRSWKVLCVRMNIYIKTRSDTRPPVADGWAGADLRVFPFFDSC